MAYIHFSVNNIADELVDLLQQANAFIANVTQAQSGTIEEHKSIATNAAKFITQIRDMMRRYIIVHSCEVRDILNGKKVKDTTVQERAKCLKSYLVEVDTRIAKSTNGAIGNELIVMIESQPPKVGKFANNQSGVAAIEHQLTYHYSEFTTVLVGPKQKNTLALKPGLELAAFMPKVGTRGKDQTGRKKHTAANAAHFFGAFDTRHNIKNSELNHVADALMQSLSEILPLMR